jgi:uncharacterized protein with ParB-like and HNH nuclease domain
MDPKETKGTAALDLTPDFQRQHVWTLEQQSAYVEYILRGGMSGRELYFNCVGWMGDYKGPFVIVDGKQRLEAVRKYLRNEIPILNGVYHKDFEDRLPSTAQFILCINNLPTRAEVLQWYLEMNSGGTPHTQEELDKVKFLLQEELLKNSK